MKKKLFLSLCLMANQAHISPAEQSMDAIESSRKRSLSPTDMPEQSSEPKSVHVEQQENQPPAGYLYAQAYTSETEEKEGEPFLIEEELLGLFKTVQHQKIAAEAGDLDNPLFLHKCPRIIFDALREFIAANKDNGSEIIETPLFTSEIEHADLANYIIAFKAVEIFDLEETLLSKLCTIVSSLLGNFEKRALHENSYAELTQPGSLFMQITEIFNRIVHMNDSIKELLINSNYTLFHTNPFTDYTLDYTGPLTASKISNGSATHRFFLNDSDQNNRYLSIIKKSDDSEQYRRSLEDGETVGHCLITNNDQTALCVLRTRIGVKFVIVNLENSEAVDLPYAGGISGSLEDIYTILNNGRSLLVEAKFQPEGPFAPYYRLHLTDLSHPMNTYPLIESFDSLYTLQNSYLHNDGFDRFLPIHKNDSIEIIDLQHELPTITVPHVKRQVMRRMFRVSPNGTYFVYFHAAAEYDTPEDEDQDDCDERPCPEGDLVITRLNSYPLHESRIELPGEPRIITFHTQDESRATIVIDHQDSISAPIHASALTVNLFSGSIMKEDSLTDDCHAEKITISKNGTTIGFLERETRGEWRGHDGEVEDGNQQRFFDKHRIIITHPYSTQPTQLLTCAYQRSALKALKLSPSGRFIAACFEQSNEPLIQPRTLIEVTDLFAKKCSQIFVGVGFAAKALKFGNSDKELLVLSNSNLKKPLLCLDLKTTIDPTVFAAVKAACNSADREGTAPLFEGITLYNESGLAAAQISKTLSIQPDFASDGEDNAE